MILTNLEKTLNLYLRLQSVLILLLLFIIVWIGIFLDGLYLVIGQLAMTGCVLSVNKMRVLFDKLGEGSIEIVMFDPNGEEILDIDASELKLSDDYKQSCGNKPNSSNE